MRGAELARGPVIGIERSRSGHVGIPHAPRVSERRSTRHRDAPCEVGLVQIRRQLGNHHRWRRREIVRVDDFEQPLRELWELCVELQLNAGGEERRTLHELLDIGVAHLDTVDPETRRELRELPGKLRAHVVQVVEFLVVVPEQTRIHFSLHAQGRGSGPRPSRNPRPYAAAARAARVAPRAHLGSGCSRRCADQAVTPP